MRRIVRALATALLVIVFVAPTVGAAPAVRSATAEAPWSWCTQILDTIWRAISGDEAGSGPAATPAEAPSGPDLGPGWDPNG